ncbi:hypothetical protein HN784_05060 [bacterium]|jgi:hypothetical protein|nr:hypothetical protein [bacterium]MBT4250734.1 hypothetical protein [bacterium]MBT4598183.1 hypothetical protein [bacterium]MBT6753781.1 hypothetical protein [bacterium]MBT7037506.1 hypothetical protein [bacterium]
MAKINLKSNEMSGRRPNSQGSNKSLVFGIVSLAVGLAVFGMVRYLTIQTENQNEEARAEVVQLENNMNTDDVKKLYDFQDRLIEIEGLMDNKVSQMELLEKIERHTLPATRFTKLEFERQSSKTEIDATVVVENHVELAKQIEAFSLIGSEVENVFLSSSKINREGSGIEGNVIFYYKDIK